ncbi:KDO2-lipid IV(A) lauroyltransferase [Hasllibacter halocynthiae]|uniref:KDO2-lipid IV(A) lauroyltransferase n=1 Tax=Hasllibacter halocynthiae TaxID=595589 RepID=A0A2T0X8X5_9RHOB|nr:lysophospholipid acyltransferase family protein [Hasllibacter halocynthiae]PRY95401.1 KDO2-lipid IV(A) lauroyltransferase [Hasllibacter halocynthiae]
MAGRIAERITDAGLRAALGAAAALPYERRIPAFGALTARLAAPAAGWRRRIEDNLDLAWPELSPHERARIVREVPDNAGRTIAETYAGAPFLRRVRDLPLTGPGADALERARAEGRPVVGVTAHLGNYNAARAAIAGTGWDFAALYRPMRNPYVEAHYKAAMESIAGPVHPRGRQGMAAIIRHLKAGGFFAILADLHVYDAPLLRFFGRPARTSVAAAELAGRHGALLVPFYGIRQPNGLDFEVRIGAEVPGGTPEARMQHLNDDLEALVREVPGQWFWVHRRWKAAAR